MKWWLSQKCLIWFHYFADCKGSQVQSVYHDLHLECNSFPSMPVHTHSSQAFPAHTCQVCSRTFFRALWECCCSEPGYGSSLRFQHQDTSAGNLFPPTTLCLFIKRNSGSENRTNLQVLKYSHLGVTFLFSFCCCCLVTKLYPTILRTADCCPLGSAVHGILQARILEWVAISFSGDFPDSGMEPVFPALAGRLFTTEPPQLF